MEDRTDEFQSLQEEFNDVFDFFTYFVQIDEEVYLANRVEVHQTSPPTVVLWDAWIWDERRPHRFVACAELITKGNIRIERLAHADEQQEAQEGLRHPTRSELGQR